jgi:hypothetical protein
LVIALLLLGSVNRAGAQRVSAYFGLGSAKDNAGTNNTCPTGQLFDGLVCENGPKLGGLFGTFGVDYMFKPHLGVNGEYSFKFKQAPFLAGDSLNMRPAFYDVNALWQPVAGKSIIPVLEGGFGAARLGLHFTDSSPITGVTDLSSFPAGAKTNRFQLHGGIGAKIYVKGNLFVKPQFDLRYVFHFTDAFGRNLVLQYSGSVGYTFGGR